MVSIDYKDISRSLFDKIMRNEFYTYQDLVLKEHLYNVDSVKDKCQEEGVILNAEELECLENIKLAGDLVDASYFRIVMQN